MFQIKYKMPICLLRWHFFKRSIPVKILTREYLKEKKKNLFNWCYCYMSKKEWKMSG